jgi:hypothetical protein
MDGDRKVTEADLGPIRYLAALLGAGDQDVLRYFILVVSINSRPGGGPALAGCDKTVIPTTVIPEPAPEILEVSQVQVVSHDFPYDFFLLQDITPHGVMSHG